MAEGGESATVQVRAIPNARTTGFDGQLEDGSWRIRIQAPPDKGRANKALIVCMSKKLGVPRSRIRIIRGEKSRHKTIRIEGISAAQVQERLSGSD